VVVKGRHFRHSGCFFSRSFSRTSTESKAGRACFARTQPLPPLPPFPSFVRSLAGAKMLRPESERGKRRTKGEMRRRIRKVATAAAEAAVASSTPLSSSLNRSHARLELGAGKFGGPTRRRQTLKLPARAALPSTAAAKASGTSQVAAEAAKSTGRGGEGEEPSSGASGAASAPRARVSPKGFSAGLRCRLRRRRYLSHMSEIGRRADKGCCCCCCCGRRRHCNKCFTCELVLEKATA
jgi:hypothetical protein